MKLAFSILLLLGTVFGYGQNHFWCITDSIDTFEQIKDTTVQAKRLKLEEHTQVYIKQKLKSSEKLVIPIVFHVLHQYGSERVSFETIQKAVELINEDYTAQNLDLNDVISEFESIVGSTNLEFRLAQINPDGECTNGVVYYDTELTNNATNNLKYTIKNWDPESYLNVWTVLSIESNAAAWSHYPGISSELDGVVIASNYVGKGHTLSHEIGHYFNLQHPWGNTNEPGIESNCDVDDLVDDTPNTIGSDGSCNLFQYSCGSLDNVQNIMDYATCDAMFTQGQVDRMRAALNSNVGSRSNLWTYKNLVKTGTQDGFVTTLCAPIADFSSVKQWIYESDSIQFKGYSNPADNVEFQWLFEGGSPSVSNEQNPYIKYSNPGQYKVSLRVKNSKGENTLVRENIIRIVDTLGGIIAPVNYNMEYAGFPYFETEIQKQWQFKNSGVSNWRAYTYQGNTALGIQNFKNNDGEVNSIISPNVNLRHIKNPDYIYFDYAYAQVDEASSDELRVYVSRNCGKNWIIRFTSRGKSLATSDNEFVSDLFIPKSNEWNLGKVNMAYNKDDNYIMLKFEMISHGGNSLYIDNIQIGETTVDVNGFEENNKVEVWPVPASYILNISFVNNYKQVAVKVYNILGKLLYTSNSNKNDYYSKLNIDLLKHNIGSGVYLLEINTGSQKSITRFVVQ